MSPLAVWWIRLGVRPERIHPGQPQENGAHERMHRTLKDENTRPAAATMEAQQHRFRGWQAIYNTKRPHESLGQTPPAAHSAPSPRRLPARLPPLEYPAQCELRLVTHGGVIRWQGEQVFLSKVLVGEYVGLHETDEGVWTITFGPITLGAYHEPLMRIIDEVGWTGPLP
ncbi:MAG: integrase core domain-containing protein [Gemmatimonadaceae bacterium]